MVIWLSYFTAFLGILTLSLYKYLTRNYDYWKKRNIFYIKPTFPFGNILPIFAFKTTLGELIWKLSDSVKNDLFGIFILDRPILIVKSSKLVKTVLQRDFTYFEDRSVVTNTDDPVMDNLLLFMRNPLWKQVRAKISPIFTSGKLKSMLPLMLHESEQMTNYLSTLANVPNVEAKEVAAKYSTNVIARCAFAVDAQSFQDENAEFRSITREMFGFRMDTALRQFCSFFTPALIKFFKIQFFHAKIIDSCKRIFSEVLESRLASDNLKGKDLIDMLIETNRKNGGNYFTKDAMVGHAIQFLGAGFETVSSSLSFALYELAIHPEMQERLREEIRESAEKENGITYAGVHDMKYLDMVVLETLRKYPAIPFLDRICKADYKLEGTDLVIEKGTAVYIPVFRLHYDSEYFPDPHKFDPERFVDKSKINNDGLFYIPFGEGPRICIGERFGLMGVKTGLASILLKYKVEKTAQTPIPIEYETKSMVLQSKVGVPLKFVPL